jgi:uncharacterized membrane protein
MRTPANIAGHPIHPMLVPLPIGLWLFSFACDVIAMFSRDPHDWKIVALYTMVGGIVGAMLAAIPGLIDFLSLPREPRKTALVHMTLNLVIVGLFAANAWWRIASPNDAEAPGMSAPVWLSLVAVLMLAVSGWLGGHLVYRHGVAVSNRETAA